MPIYDYQCSKCGHEEEFFQKISDDPIKVCPACGKSSMEKMVSAPSFRLKGGGWYETDFKSGDKKNLADSGEKKKPADKPKGKSSGGTTDKAKKKSK